MNFQRNSVIIVYYRCGHTAVLIESRKSVLIFGGHAGGNFIGDLWEYSLGIH